MIHSYPNTTIHHTISLDYFKFYNCNPSTTNQSNISQTINSPQQKKKHAFEIKIAESNDNFHPIPSFYHHKHHYEETQQFRDPFYVNDTMQHSKKTTVVNARYIDIHFLMATQPPQTRNFFSNHNFRSTKTYAALFTLCVFLLFLFFI